MGMRTIITIVTLLLAQGAWAGEYDDVVIVRMDDRGIVFEYRPVDVRLELSGAAPASDGGSARHGNLKYLAIGNCARTAGQGNFDLPVRVVLLGIPAVAKPEVNAWVDGETIVSGGSAAVIEQSLPGLGQSASEFALKEKSEVEKRVAIENPFWIGNQRVLRIKVFPANYDISTEQYRVAGKLQVEVKFNSSDHLASSSMANAWDKVLKNGLLNYEEAKGFRNEPQESGKLSKPTPSYSPFSQSSNWVKVTFQENGIYKIDRAMLAALVVPISTIDPQTFRIFSMGGRALPAFNNVPRPAWQEHSIEVTGEQDGIFDTGDEIHFYGWAVEGWDYDTLSGSFKFTKNVYTTTQAFWLTWGGSFGNAPLRIATYVVLGSGPAVTSFPARFRFEQDRFLAVDKGSEINDYYTWYGGKGTSQTYFFNLPDLVSNPDTIMVGHLSGGVSLSVNSSFATTSKPATFITSALKAGLNRVDLGITTNGSGLNHFDYLEIFYNRLPIFSSPLLEFETPVSSGIVTFQIRNSPVKTWLWLVTNRFSPTGMSGTRDATGVFSFNVDATKKHFFILASGSDIKRPTLSQVAPVVLTGFNQGEFIFIAPASFQSTLSSYVAHRAAFSGVTVKQVDVEQIYNNFSGGLPDPVAIRDFLKFARENWGNPKPRYVLLAGDGTYDFRNIEGTGAANYVPPFIVDQAFDASSNSDEGYLYFRNPGFLDSSDQVLDMTIARWPVKNVSELQVVADKIMRYESSPEYGVWRNRITLVADDEFGAFDNEGFHTFSSEQLASRHTPRRLDQKKIYLFDYPFNGLREKPEAEQAILRAWNEGQLIINYVGHGSPNLWAHEHVLKREEDVPQMVNTNRLPLVYAASCNINSFVEPLSEGMGEDLLKSPAGGAVAVIASVRIVFAGPNNDLNDKVFDLLLGTDSLSIGEAFYLAKLLRQPNGNDRRFLLFGDPAMHIAFPKYNVRLTAIPDSLSALSVAAVSGEVTDRSGIRLNSFNGNVTLMAFDGLRFKSHPLDPAPQPYSLPGNMIYRGEAQAANGRFSFSFVVPKDISYGSKTGKISVYAFDATGDAVGFKDSMALGGSVAVTTDTVGPKISLAVVGGGSVGAGDVISVGVNLSVKLEDSSGINITGEPAHSITAEFDFPSGPTFDITSSFRYEQQSFSRGEAFFTVPAVSTGRHTLRIKAWDSANNSSVLEFPIEVAASGKLLLSNVLNYPNPMKDKTNFCYTLSAPADEVMIEIFSEAGRLIKTIRSASVKAGYNFQTEWNGRDNDGDAVASGIYLYKVCARQASKEVEDFGKIVVMR